MKKDIANHDRRFEVWVDKRMAGVEAVTEVVIVPAGEDADEWCKDVWDTLVGNEIDSGWRELTEGEESEE